MKHLLPPIPDGEGEHPDEPAHCFPDTPGAEGGEHHLGVGVPAEPVAEPFQFLSEAAEIEDLAVEGDDEASVGALHWLVPEWTEVDDGQAPVSKPEGSLAPEAGIVGAPVCQGIAHPLHDRRIRGRAAAPDADNAAHVRSVPPNCVA